MDEFDKEFDNAPNASFDDEFEKAESVPEKSLMDKEIPLTPFVNPTLNDVADTAKPILETAHDFGAGAAQGATLGAADEIGGAIAATGEEISEESPLLQKALNKIGKGLSYVTGDESFDGGDVLPYQAKEAMEKQGIVAPEESFLEKYRGYQKASEQEFKAANDRSPMVNTLGNIGGSLTTGIVAGKALGLSAPTMGPQPLVSTVAQNKGKVQGLLDLMKGQATTGSRIKDFVAQAPGTIAATAPIAATESVLNSQGTLTDEQGREKILQDMGSDLAVGLPAVLGVKGAVDVAAPAAKQAMSAVDDRFSKFVQDNPFLRKYGIGIKHGEMGTKPTSEGGLKNLENLEKIRTRGMLDNIYQTDTKLGADVGNSIKNATQKGVQVNIDAPVRKSLTDLNLTANDLYKLSNDTSSNGKKVLGKIANFINTTTNPTEAKELINDIDAYIGKFDATRMKTQADDDILDILHSVRSNVSNQLKTDVPEYAQAAERFNEFRRLVPETILSKDTPSDISNVFMGNLRNVDTKLYKGIEDLQMGATAQGSGAKSGRQAYDNLIKGMKEFELNEKVRNENLIRQGKAPNANPLVHSSDEFNNLMSKFSDEANFLRDVQTVKSPFVTGQNLASTVGQFGHSGALSTSLLVGRAKKPITEISRKAYNMPAQQLNSLADRMMTSPGLKTLGQGLKDGLSDGDQARKNAAIFSILQNPEARLFLDEDEEN